MRNRGIALMAAGVAVMFVAGLVSVASYVAAVNSPAGGLYFVLFGPIILGAFMVIRGAAVTVHHSARTGPPP